MVLKCCCVEVAGWQIAHPLPEINLSANKPSRVDETYSTIQLKSRRATDCYLVANDFNHGRIGVQFVANVAIKQ